MNSEPKIFVNTRALNNHLTGVQRYITELVKRLPECALIHPNKTMQGIAGHAWEQAVLPALMPRKGLLWSPSNSGPIAVGHQVVTLHDVVPLDHPEWLNWRFASWYRFLTPRLLNRVTKIITDAEYTRLRIIKHCPEAESKICVIPLAADERFRPTDVDTINQTRKKLGIPSASYIVALGSLEPRKNLVRLLKAWAAIEARVPDDVWLVLAGAQGKKLVFGDVSFEKLPPRVHLTGYVPDELLPALYSGAIAAPYLSYYEGFGFPPLEAMACGTPVLTSNVTSLPEVVGDAGLMADPYDTDEIADGLIRLIEDSCLRDELRHKGLIRARQFNWDKTAELTWQVLHQAANE